MNVHIICPGLSAQTQIHPKADLHIQAQAPVIMNKSSMIKSVLYNTEETNRLLLVINNLSRIDDLNHPRQQFCY